MNTDDNQPLIDTIVTKSLQCDNSLHDNVLELIELYRKGQEDQRKLLKQNQFFLKQWDKNNILLKEKDAKKDRMLEQQSKMAAMGEMMDAVAHQWKQPLNALVMMSDLLRSDYEEGIVSKEYIENITDTANNQIEHLLTTLSEFRTFFRPTKEENHDFLLNDCIKSVQVLMKDELIINNIIIYLRIEDGLTICGKENEFKHLFLNLINNSIDIFEERKKFASRHIYIRSYREDRKIYIEFEDNAGGIPQELIEDVFKPNVTSKEEGKGTGIGLYMSSQIVQKHHGQINVHNSNMGAFFTIILNS